jgi:uncharacterized membrane protein YjdF
MRHASDVCYQTPLPRDSFEETVCHAAANGDVQQLQRLLAESTAAHRCLSGCIVDCAIRSRSEQCVESTLLYPDVDFTCCGPVRVAVEMNDNRMLRMVLDDLRFDINVGCPLRVASENGNAEAVDLIMQDERCNVNKGFPLYHAIARGHFRIVKRLLGTLSTFVNRLTPGYGTTPLCKAIENGDEACFFILLSHPRIDVNKGCFMTPLQHCIAQQNSHFLNALLARPTIDVNKTIGWNPSPIEMALASRHTDITRSLLRDTRLILPERLIDELEKTDDFRLLQYLAEEYMGHTQFMGSLYRTRLLWYFAFIVMELLMVVCSLSVVDDQYRMRRVTTTPLYMTACLHTVAAIATYLTLRRATSWSNNPCNRWLSLAPILPLFEVFAFYKMGLNITRTTVNLYERHDIFIQLQVAVTCHSLLSAAPNALLQYIVYSSMKGPLAMTEREQGYRANMYTFAIVVYALCALKVLKARQLWAAVRSPEYIESDIGSPSEMKSSRRNLIA